MIADDNITRRDGDDPIEVIVARLEQELADLQSRLGSFDPASFKEDVNSDFATLRSNTEKTVQSLEVHLTAAVAKINSFEKLLKDASDLLKRLEAIDFKALDAEKIKAAVLAALEEWRNQTDNRLSTLEALVSKLEADVKNISPEKIRDAVLDALKDWKEKVEQDLAQHKEDLKKFTADLVALQAQVDDLKTAFEKAVNELQDTDKKHTSDIDKIIVDLTTLTKRVDELDFDPDFIKSEVERLIADWKAQVEGRLTALEALKSKVADLESRLDKLPHIFSESEIKQLIDNALVAIDLKINEVKTEVLLKIKEVSDLFAADLGGLNTRLLVVEEWIKNHKADLDKIVILVLKELEAWQKQLEQRVTVLEAQRSVDRSDIDKLIQGLSDLVAKVNALVILTQQDVINLININLQPWITKIDSIEKTIVLLQGSSQSHNTDILLLKTAVKAIEDILNGPLPANWETQIRQIINDLIAALKADVVQLKTDKITLENALAVLDSVVKGLETALNELQEQVNTLWTKEQIEAFVAGEIAKLKTKLAGDISALDTRIAVLEAMDDALLLKIDALEKEDIELNKKIADLHELFVLLKDKVDNLPPIPKAEDIVKEVETIIIKWKEEVQIEIIKLIKCCEDGKKKFEDIDIEITKIKEELNKSDGTAIGIRLARRCLTGWGVINGLEIKSDDTCAIHIYKGSGITPRGVLVHACEPMYFTHYRKYETTDPAFKGYPLWELLVWETLGIEPGEAVPDDIEPLTPQTGKESETPFIADKAVILLPGNYQNHYLLLRIDDLIALQGKTTAVQKFMGDESFDPDMQFSEPFSPLDALPTEDDLYKAFYPVMLLPEIPLFRFGFRPPDECDPEDLDDPNFPQICSLDHLYETWQPIIQDAFRQMDKWWKAVMSQYHDLLFPQLDIEIFEEKHALLFEKWAAFTTYNKKTAANKTRKYYIQYFYDWARDLIAGYHELRSELQILMAEFCLCRPDLLLEQRPYLMLGPAVRPNHDGLAAPLRDAFHQPPIFNSNAIRLETCRLYYRRQFEMMEGFYLNIYDTNDNKPCWCHNDDGDWEPDFSRLRITPSKGYIHALSRQSLPFYYPLAPNMESLHFYWEYRRAKMRQNDYHLSYHASDADDSYSHRPEVVRPLYYSLDAYDFYRIEGAVGKYSIDLSPKVALHPTDALLHMVKRYNLDFEVLEVDIACNQCHFLSQKHPMPVITPQEFFHSFRQDLMGAEHLAGVPKGGTFIIVTSQMVLDNVSQKVVIADFALPYRCCPAKPKQCSIELFVEVDKNCTNGQRGVVSSLTISNATGNTLLLFVDKADKPLTTITIDPNVPGESVLLPRLSFPADNNPHSIKVIDPENPCCNAEWEGIIAACCTINVTAVVAQGNCVGGKRNVKLTIQKSGTGTSPGFNIEVGGKPYPFGTPDSYAYGSGAKTDLTIELTGNADAQNIEIIDALNSDCRGRVPVTVPKCPCAMTVQVKRLNRTNNGVMMELIVNTENPESSEFSFSYSGVNVDIQRVFAYNKSGPASTFQIEVPVSELEHRIIVHDMKNTACRAETTFIPVEFVINRPSAPRKPSKPKK